MDSLTVGIFGASAPMIVAQSMSFFHQHDLEVTYTRVASSEEQFRDFAAGGYDLLQTAFDNVASYRLNASNPLGGRLPVTAFFALDGGMDLSILAGPHIRSITDLRGRTVSLDAPDTGYAFVLFRLLESAGLMRGADYEIVSHGGVVSRYQRLLDGDADATLLSNGLEIVAAARGLNRIGRSRDVLHPYLGSVIAAQEPWLLRNADIAARFREAYERALEYTVEPANIQHVTRLVAEARSIPIELASGILAAELQDVGIARSTTILEDAARAVLNLRASCDGFDSEPDIDSLVRPGSELLTRA